MFKTLVCDHIDIPIDAPLSCATKLSFLARHTPSIQATIRHIEAWKKITNPKPDAWYLVTETHTGWKLDWHPSAEKFITKVMRKPQVDVILLWSQSSELCVHDSEELSRRSKGCDITGFVELTADVRGLLCYLVKGRAFSGLLRNAEEAKITTSEKREETKADDVTSPHDTVQVMRGLPINNLCVWASSKVLPYVDFASTNYNGFHKCWGLVGFQKQTLPRCDVGFRGFLNPIPVGRRWIDNLIIMKQHKYWIECKALLEFYMMHTYDMTVEEQEFGLYDEWSIVAWQMSNMTKEKEKEKELLQLGVGAAYELLRRNRFHEEGRKRLMKHKERLLKNIVWYKDKALSEAYRLAFERMENCPF